MASLKTTTQDALQVTTQKGIKGLDKVGQTATAMKGSLNLPPRAHLALAGMGGIPNQAPSKIAQGTENLKDVLRKFDVNLGGGSKRADGIIEKASGAKLNKLSPKDINNMSLDDLRKSIPDDWQIFENNGRVHIKDANGNFRVRIDPPDKITNYEHMHIFDENKNPLDIKGNIVDKKSPDGHIPWTDK